MHLSYCLVLLLTTFLTLTITSPIAEPTAPLPELKQLIQRANPGPTGPYLSSTDPSEKRQGYGGYPGFEGTQMWSSAATSLSTFTPIFLFTTAPLLTTLFLIIGSLSLATASPIAKPDAQFQGFEGTQLCNGVGPCTQPGTAGNGGAINFGPIGRDINITARAPEAHVPGSLPKVPGVVGTPWTGEQLGKGHIGIPARSPSAEPEAHIPGHGQHNIRGLVGEETTGKQIGKGHIGIQVSSRDVVKKGYLWYCNCDEDGCYDSPSCCAGLVPLWQIRPLGLWVRLLCLNYWEWVDW